MVGADQLVARRTRWSVVGGTVVLSWAFALARAGGVFAMSPATAKLWFVANLVFLLAAVTIGTLMMARSRSSAIGWGLATGAVISQIFMVLSISAVLSSYGD